MKKSKFSDVEIVSILKQQEDGVTAKELCRINNISEVTFYNWKRKFSVNDIPEIRKYKDLMDENVRLKKMFAELSIDLSILKDGIFHKV